eukprot:7978675-Pyramimonas_sp.AAC.1
MQTGVGQGAGSRRAPRARLALTQAWAQDPAGSCRALRIHLGLGAGSCRVLQRGPGWLGLGLAW